MESFFLQIVQKLVEAQIENPRLEARLMFAEVLHRSPSEIFQDISLTDEENKEVEAILEQRLQHKPLDKILGHREFYKYEFKVSRNCFYPSPNVDSAIVSMKKNKKECGLNNEAKFLKFVQDIFETRRKTLINNILRKYPIEKDKINTIFGKMGLDLNVRSESLDIDTIIDLYKNLDI